MKLPGGVLARSQCRRRQDLLPRLGGEHRYRFQRRCELPGVLKDRRHRHDRQLRPSAPVPGAIYIGRTSAGQIATGCSSPGTDSGPHQVGQLVDPGPCDEARSSPPRRSAQSPLTEFNMSPTRRRARPAGNTGPVHTYPVVQHLHPMGRAGCCPNQTSTQFFTIDSGPGGAPCPGPTRPLGPGLRGELMGNSAGAHSPFSIDLTRNDGDQNLAGLTVSTPPGFSALSAGPFPTARIPPWPTSQTPPILPSRRAAGLCLPGVPGRHGDRWCWAPETRPLYVSGRCTWPGRIGGSTDLAIVSPPCPGHTTSATWSVRTGLDVDPGTLTSPRYS